MPKLAGTLKPGRECFSGVLYKGGNDHYKHHLAAERQSKDAHGCTPTGNLMYQLEGRIWSAGRTSGMSGLNNEVHVFGHEPRKLLGMVLNALVSCCCYYAKWYRAMLCIPLFATKYIILW